MRNTFIRLLPALAVAVGLTVPILSGCSGSAPAVQIDPTDPDLIVAESLGDTLTLNAFEDAYIAANGDRASATDDSLGAYQDFLERYVNFRLKVRQARELGLDRDSTIIAEMAEYRDQLARPYFTNQAVLDDIIADLYEKQREEIDVSHLLIRADENASPEDTLLAFNRVIGLRDSINAGSDFEEMAFLRSEDPSARRNRGNLGYFTGGRMVQGFEDAAYGAAVGEMVGPVRTRFGYHLIKVNDRRPRTAEIRASHILIRIQGDTADDTTAARTTLEELEMRIEAGEDFATLARQYSDDVASGREGGDLGFFGVGRMVESFNEAVFALENVGDIADIVASRFGFHLIRLEERKELPTYEEALPDLKRLANDLPRTAIRRRQIGEEELEAAGYTFDPGLVEAAIRLFDADSLFLQLRRDGFGDLSEASFATVGDTSFTFEVFRTHLTRSGVRPGADQVAQFHTEMDNYLADQGFNHALNTLEERDPAFRTLLGQYVDGVLLFRISEDSVWTPAAQDVEGLRAYHTGREDRYNWPERRRVLAFTSPSDSMLTLVSADLDAGHDAQDILARYEESTLTLRLDTLFIADSTSSPLDAALSLEVGQRSDVVPERSRLAIYYLDAIEAPRLKTFTEARAELVTEYQEVLEGYWVERLRAQYQTTTYPNRLVGAFKEPRMGSIDVTGSDSTQMSGQ